MAERVISPHDLAEISPDPTRSHQMLDGSGKISSDLVRSRHVSANSNDYWFHPKLTTTHW